MLKKLLLISVVCISLMALSGTNANAYPQRLGGWPTFPGSVYMITTWVGISDTLQRPADAWATLRIKSFLIDEVSNGGGQHGGIGTPWITQPTNPVIVDAGGTIFDIPLKGKGKYDLPIEFTDQFLSQQIKSYCARDDLTPEQEEWCNQLPPLPNDNWYWHVVVLEMDVLIQGFTDIDPPPDGRCEDEWNPKNCMERVIYDEDGVPIDPPLKEEEVVFAVGLCTFPGIDLENDTNEDIVEWVTNGFDWDNPDPYNCTENFNWQYKNKSQTCEDESGYDCDYIDWYKYNYPPYTP